jgi:hypothetical protein
MSRIERYQESINKFIKSKDIFPSDIKDLLLKRDHLCGIIFATLLNHNSKKTNFKVHGYYIACAIDLLHELIEIIQRKKEIEHNKFTQLVYLVIQLVNLNLENIKVSQKQEDILNKIIFFAHSYIISKLSEITKQYEFQCNKKVLKSDLLSISYIDKTIINKYKNLFKIDHNILLDYVTNTYGNVGDIVFVIGWAIGGGDRKPELMKNLQSIGDKFGLLYKLCRDFEKIEEDINNANDVTGQNKYSLNFIINDGVQESFILFMEIKTQLIEDCLSLNIYTHTLKEVLDELEKNVDKCLSSSSIDLKSTYSSVSK